jgi:uncharacterized membrane protein YcaP (DUF421 family)
MEAALRAFFGYVFLLLVVRIAGRRPGKQLAPFEFVLIFFIGGLALTAMVGDDMSFTNAVCEILAVAVAHLTISTLRSKSVALAKLFDGTPLILLNDGRWQSSTLEKMRIQPDDVMSAAREQGLRALRDIDRAVLERNGEISILKRR